MADCWLRNINEVLQSEKRKQKEQYLEFEYQEDEIWDCVNHKESGYSMEGNESAKHVKQLSAPIKIATNPKVSIEEDDEDEEMIPPHKYIAQKIARVRATGAVAAYSIFEGIGRTLKGRDLFKLRNAILIKTGFIEQIT